VFLARVPMDFLPDVFTSGLLNASAVIEEIEEVGWRLDQMSWVQRAQQYRGTSSGMRPEGFFLFRRP
jgi:hypothetical protein